jgi:hypothetical protein
MLTTVSWSSVNTPLQSQLADLMKQSDVAVIRDRRIDPRSQISLTASSVSRWEVLKNIAGEVPDGGCCLTENVAYVGPAPEVYRLPVLIELRQNEINQLRRKMKPEDHRKLVALVDSSWAELDEPKLILDGYARAVGVRITNPDLIPHDVWAQCSLPRMAFAEIATIVLNQFELEFRCRMMVGQSLSRRLILRRLLTTATLWGKNIRRPQRNFGKSGFLRSP